MQPGFAPRAHPSALTGAFHDYVRGVFAERSAHAPRLKAARVLWLRQLAQRLIRDVTPRKRAAG